MPTVKRRKRKVVSWDDIAANPVPGDVLACLDEIGLEVIRIKGEEAEAKCPAHLKRTGKEDRHPSFSVNLDEGVFGCFSCGFKGRFVHLVAEMLDLPEDDAVAWVRERGGIERVRRVLAKHESGLLIDVKDTTNNVNEASLALYTDVPQEEAAKRNISVEACNELGIRWDPETERWITPIREPYTNRLMGWQEKNKRVFLNQPYDVRKGDTLFGFNEAKDEPVKVLIESPLDVARARTAGYDNHVSSYGAMVTEAQMNLIIETSEVVIIGLDNDREGRRQGKVLKQMYSKRVIMRFLDYTQTDAKDEGDMTDAEIHYAVGNAVSSLLVKF